MRLDLVSFRGTTPAGAGSSLLADWRVGTILQAVAIRDAKTGQLWLELSGQRHPARVASGNDQGPADGERMQVRVLRTHPVLALETLGTSKAADLDANVIAGALRRLVPKQESPSLLLANLAWLAQGKNSAHPLPKSVLEAAVRLWQALPDPEALTNPKDLERALRLSGTFLESNLASASAATARANVAHDLKALMLALSRALQDSGARPAAARSDTAGHASVPTASGPLTPLSAKPATFSLLDTAAQQMNELARQTDGALARLATVQIANNTTEPTVQSILIELPVRHDDRANVLRLRIEQDNAQGGTAERQDAWSVEAAIDLGAVGAVHARVTLSGQRIGVQLRAESAAIVTALSARTGELESMLREVGLEIDRVVCLHGMPAGDGGARPARLLDVRA